MILNAEEYARNLSSDEVIKVMEDALKRLAVIAEKEDVTILVEPVTGGFFTSSKQAFGLIVKM